MKEVEFSKWDDFVRFVRDESNQIYPVIWRGQRDHRWVLASAFEREVLRTFGGGRIEPSDRHPYGNHLTRVNGHVWCEGMTDRMLNTLLEDFKRFAAGCRGPHPKDLDDDQWWALGRHYGLVTPLLDWSESPFIAAFFALSELASSIGPSVRTRLPTAEDKVAVFKLFVGPAIQDDNCLRVLRPEIDELGRAHGQQSIFTRLKSQEFFDLQSYLDNTGRGDHLTKVILTERLLYIEGAAREANYRSNTLKWFANFA